MGRRDVAYEAEPQACESGRGSGEVARGRDDGGCHSAPYRTGGGSVPLSFGLDYNGKAQVSSAKTEPVSDKRSICLAYSLVKERET